jgi:NAD(P)-dependent dehydrogenase (short-subunit alcohol dehydrogenase family)
MTLAGQTVVVLGGSAGIGFETARLARAEGAELILTARDAARLDAAARELGGARTAAFDATDPGALAGFLAELGEIDHILITAGGPYYAPLPEIDFAEAQRSIDAHLWLPLRVAQGAIGKMRAGGTLILVGGTGGRRPTSGAIASALTASLPALVAGLAVEVAPVRANLIAPGFVDTGLSASLLGDDLDARREQLRETLPIGRVVGPADVAALAVHLMTNTALTGATYDIDGGQQLV